MLNNENKYCWEGKTIKEVVLDEINDQLENHEGQEVYACDLSNELLNADYFIIGTYEARQFVKEFIDEFSEMIHYQKDNFGEVLFQPEEWERIAGQIVLTYGKAAISQCEIVLEAWNDEIEISKEFISQLMNELKGLSFDDLF